MEETHEKRKFSEEESETTTKRPNANVSVRIDAQMDCPNDKVGHVIGKNGSTVKIIMEKSGCKIRLDPNPLQDPRKVYLTGSPEDLSKAMQLIMQVIREGPNALNPPEETVDPEKIRDEDDVTIPHSKVSTLIGSRGLTINEIMKRTDCKIHVIQDGVPDGVDRKVSFIGSIENIEKGKALVREVIENGAGVLGATIFENEEQDIQPSKVGLIIGAKGSTLSEIMRLSRGCKIYVNQQFPEGHPHKIVYSGTQEQIQTAKNIVQDVLHRGLTALTAYQPNPSAPSSFMHPVHNHVYGSGFDAYGLGMRGGPLPIPPVPVPGLGGRAHPSHYPSPYGHPYHSSYPPTPSPSPTNATAAKQQWMMRGGGGGGVAGAMFGSEFEGFSEGFDYHAGTGGGGKSLTSRGAKSGRGGGEKELFGGSSSGSVLSAGGIEIPPPGIPVNDTTFTLGEDGQLGILEPPSCLSDGSHRQVAEVRSSVVGKVIGKNSSTLVLIRAKSGANLQFMKPGSDTYSPDKPGYTRIYILGSPSAVSTAAQMIQEVLINGAGTAKILLLPDVLPTSPSPSNFTPLVPSPSSFYPGGNTAHPSYGGGFGMGGGMYGTDYGSYPSSSAPSYNESFPFPGLLPSSSSSSTSSYMRRSGR